MDNQELPEQNNELLIEYLIEQFQQNQLHIERKKLWKGKKQNLGG